MHKIHIKNITHLDLKLENIFACNGKYKIADYGGLKKTVQCILIMMMLLHIYYRHLYIL